MNIIQETKFIMNKYNIRANKNLGQNFLIDENALEEIVNSSEISKNDLIIEIGPGLGTLTSLLIEKAGKVICVELDLNMITVLKDRFSLYDNFELIHDDILKIDLDKIIKNNLENNNLNSAKIVANLPYYITTPIIMKLLENKLDLKSITVMVQKEVAERLTEKPGNNDTGAITYSINYYTDPELITRVSNTSFVPSPKVDSAVIKLNVLKNPKVIVSDEKLFFKIIKSAFMQKRKTLLNSLSNANIQTKEYLQKMLIDLNIDLKIRPENLTLEQFAEITDYIDHSTPS